MLQAFADNTPAPAVATDAAAQGGNSGIMVLVIYAAIFAVFYFMLIAPQRKRTKKEAQMRANVKVGDEIVTSGGIYGKVLQIKDDTLVIEVNADKGKLRIAKWAIQEVKQLISE